jgi:hypothetical protein
VWFPNLAPSPETIKLGLSADSQREWGAFVKRYRAEMAKSDNSRALDLLAALSQESNFSIGCRPASGSSGGRERTGPVLNMARLTLPRLGSTMPQARIRPPGVHARGLSPEL